MGKIKAILILVLITLTGQIFAQAPPGFSFQGILKDNQGAIAKTLDVYVKVQIVKGSISGGQVVYEEVHTTKTNADGIFSIIIGQGLRTSGVTGLFSIEWGRDAYFINMKVGLPPTILTKWYDPSLNYTDFGTTQLWSVPYALYSGNTSQAGLITSGMKSGNPDIILLNGQQSAPNTVIGNADVSLSIKPGQNKSVLQTDSLGKVAWVTIKDSKLVSGVLKIISLTSTTTGETYIPSNSIIRCRVTMDEARLGDPVFVTGMDDTTGFSVYSAYVSAIGEVSIRFVNYQDSPAGILVQKFSILLIK